jgi:hypothetical protein
MRQTAWPRCPAPIPAPCQRSTWPTDQARLQTLPESLQRTPPNIGTRLKITLQISSDKPDADYLNFDIGFRNLNPLPIMDDIWNDMLIGLGGLFALWLTVRLLGSALRIAQNWFDDRRDANCGSSLLAETLLFEPTRQHLRD